MNLCADEILVRLVEKDRIAAVTYFSADPDSSTLHEEVVQIPQIKGNIEEVLKYEPDLVIAGVFSNQHTREALDRLGIPVLLLNVADSFAGIYENIMKVAEATDTIEVGEDIISDMKKRLSAIEPLHHNDPILALFYQRTGNTPGRSTYQDSIFQAVGLENLAVREGIVGHGHLSLERLVATEPDLLVFWQKGNQKEYSVGSEILKHPAIKKGLPDVKIVTLPTQLLNCGAPSSVEAVELLHSKVKEVFS